jgi:hypothetical protein
MSAMKEHFGMIARCLGCTEDNWDQTVDTLDQFASGRATLVFVRCWCGGLQGTTSVSSIGFRVAQGRYPQPVRRNG